MATDSTIAEMDISGLQHFIINGNPLLFYGVVVTGGVAIVLILCLILVCLSLAYRNQRHRGNPFSARVQLVEERGTGQDLYDDVVSARRSMPATIVHGTGQTGSGNEAMMLHKYEVIQRESTGVSPEGEHTGHNTTVHLDGRGIKNPVYYKDSEVDGGRGGSGSGSGTGQTHDDLTPRQPTELYNTLVQVGGRNSNDHINVLQQESTPTYAMLK